MTPAVPTIGALAADYRAGRTSALETTEACLARIETLDPAINAFTQVYADDARRAARAADEERARGVDRGPLHGIPVSLKDIIDVAGHPTTCASRVREGHRALHDAEVVARLRRAGAVVIGKTNLHEFALGTTNEDSAFGPVRHPLDHARSPGGSSGGSAAAVLSGMCHASIGTDTGGSIRIPAAACGLVGLKPSYDELPLDGVFPLSRTLDHVGPIGRSVDDARLLYEAMGGAPGPMGMPDVRGRRFGVLRGYFSEKIDAIVASAFEAVCTRLRDAGAVLEDVSVAQAPAIGAVYLLISLPEAAAVHADALDVCPERFTPNVRTRLDAARYLLAEDAARARQGQRVLRLEVDALLAGLDGLLTPTMPILATRLGHPTVTVGGVEEPVRAMTLRGTQLFNLTGHPAITIPCPVTEGHLPVGLQIAGHGGGSAALLRTAAAIEAAIADGPGSSH